MSQISREEFSELQEKCSTLARQLHRLRLEIDRMNGVKPARRRPLMRKPTARERILMAHEKQFAK